MQCSIPLSSSSANGDKVEERSIGFYCTHLDVFSEEKRIEQLRQMHEHVDANSEHFVFGDFSILTMTADSSYYYDP